MRLAILTASLLAFAAPAGAQSLTDDVTADIVDSFPAPGETREMAYAMDRVLGALFALPVGDLVNAVDPDGRAEHPDTTLGDLASRDDPYAEDRARRSLYDAAGAVDEASGRIALLAPVVARALDRLERDIEDAIRAYPE